MTVEIATLFTGVAVIVGACIAGGICWTAKNSRSDKQTKINAFVIAK